MSESEFRSDSLDHRRETARWELALDAADRQRNRNPFCGFRLREELHWLIKRALAEDIKECAYSREQIAEGLTRLVGRTITVAQIDAWTAETKIGHRFPAEMIPAWSRVTVSRRVLDLVCAEAGCWVQGATEHDLAELGRAQLQAEKVAGRIAELKARVQEKV
jgi:hypothetical protein